MWKKVKKSVTLSQVCLEVNVTEAPQAISIHSAPPAILCLIYFEVMLSVHTQNERIDLGESLTHCKLMLINTSKDIPTKSESSNNQSREHLQTHGNGL